MVSINSLGEALLWARRCLSASPDAALDARLLLQHVLSVNHAFLVGHSRDRLTAEQWEAYQTLVSRAQEKEPLPYIIGQAGFYGRQFVVTPAVLIPRPETEQLVELALGWTRERPGAHLADVGTGSGCIVVTLACEAPDLLLSATDCSLQALAIAAKNAQRHHVAERIRFYEGEQLEPLQRRPDLIIANLPYISDAEWTALNPGVKSYEPAIALRGGPDGLRQIRRLLLQAAAGRLRPQGAILLELGWQQGQAALRLATGIFPRASVTLRQDLAGLDRVVEIQT